MVDRKTRRSVTLDPELEAYVDANVDNFSGFVNDILWQVLGEDPLDGPEAETVRVRQRVCRMHMEVLEKEIAELQRQYDELDKVLSHADDDKSIMWRTRLDRMIHGRHAGRPRKEDMAKDE